MSVEPEVSAAVLMTAYNAETTIRASLGSALATGEPLEEVVVVLDGCTDGTEAIVRELAEGDSRVRVVAMPRIGRGAALNVGLAEVRATHVAVLDADDEMSPRRIAVQVDAILRSPMEVAAVACAAVDDARRLDDAAPEHVDAAIARAVDVTPALRRGNPLVHSTVLFRTASLRAVGGYDPGLRGSFDYDVYVRIAAAGGAILALPMALVVANKTSRSFFEGRGGFAYRVGALARQVHALRVVPGSLGDWGVLLLRVGYLAVPEWVRERRRLGAVPRSRGAS